MRFKVGIDDFGTATKESQGWAFVCLSELQATEFSTEATAILGGGLKVFHGKKFTRKSKDHYKDFLTLLKEKCCESPENFITCTLNEKSWHQVFIAFAERTLQNSFGKAGVTNPEPELEILRHIVSPIFTFLRVSIDVGGGHSVAISLDDNHVTKSFNTAKISIQGVGFSLPHLAEMLYNAYRIHKFSSSPIQFIS